MSGDRSLGIGDLPVAGPVSSTDTLAICQSPTGCFASDSSVTLRGVSQSQLATYYQSTFAGTAPITFSGGNIGLTIDSTLQVTAGQLGVVAPSGPPITIPSAPLLGGNGNILGSVALGTNLSLTGTFPNQTLDAAGVTGGPFLPLSGGTVTGEIVSSINPTNADALTTNRLLSQQIGDVVTLIGNYLPLSGGALTGTLRLFEDPVNAMEAATKQYVDSHVGGTGFLPLTGGTMTGPLTMSGAAGAGVFRTIYGGGINGMAVALGDLNTGFHRSQGTTPQAPVYLNIANASNVTTPVMTWDLASNLSQLAVNLSMTNHAITFVLDPVNPQDAATKNYVDTRPGGGGGITGITAGPGITVTPDPVSPTVAVVATGLPVTLGGTGGTTQATARTGLGLGTVATQNSPLGTAYGGTGSNSSGFTVNSILMATGATNALTTIPTAAVTTVLHGGAPPSYGPVSLNTDVLGTLPVLFGGTGATTFTPGNLIGMGGANAFVGVATPITVGLGGTGATNLPISNPTPTFSITGTLLQAQGTSPIAPTTNNTRGTMGTWDGGNLVIIGAGQLGMIDLVRCNSTLSAPSAVLSGQQIGTIAVDGYGATAWSTNSRGVINCDAAETWTNTAQGTYFNFLTTTPTTTTTAERLRIGQGVMIGGTYTDMGSGTVNAGTGYYANSVGADSLSISWLAGIDPNNAVLVVAQRTLTLTNVRAVIRASNAGATLQLRRGDNTNMLTTAFDLGQPAAVYTLPLAITTLAANDFLYLATTGAPTTSVAHVTVVVA